MIKTNIIAAVRIMLSIAMAGPAQAWPGPSSSVDCASDGEPGTCEALTLLVRRHALAHHHSRKLEHAVLPFTSSHQPDHEQDPLASMHFE
ncbi:hypothetical protein G8O24_27680 [Bradyrhizobium sp. INPA01-394B]|uniref:Uncharacterized protein n=1 Tax=Bradyrhizobium campsiandrae TaxID=1729892 RepID=A0ABR7U817_9BRAD|nr:hypothetical protein [Bradyrhizobium campsiandrae]MBC9881114.1 hypothetical protein [Bradyrhizobium campsiandrae]MBC9979968.1 hypothetical protein [Bradyrhizobium campsiandrae]